MIAVIALLIGVVVILILLTLYFQITRLANQCIINPQVWCYKNWECEASSDRIGNIACNGDCPQAIVNFMTNPTTCADGCNTANCQCKWSPTTTGSGQPQSSGASLCSTAGTDINPGTFICGQAAETCPATGVGCNPYCIEAGPECC